MTHRGELDLGGISEGEFLSRIRSRMNAKSAKEPYPGSSIWPEDHEENVTYSEKVQLFTRALEGLGGRALRATALGAAYGLIAKELVAAGAKRVLLTGGNWTDLEQALTKVGVAFDRWSEVNFSYGSHERELDRVNAWDAGIGWADYAVADLGSIALLFDAEQGRSVNLVPPRYIALLRRDALVQSRRTVLEDVSRRFRESGQNGSFVFVTGPSRSADIEMDLSIGVHGPGEVWAVLVDE